jgi:hypothetical protein
MSTKDQKIHAILSLAVGAAQSKYTSLGVFLEGEHAYATNGHLCLRARVGPDFAATERPTETRPANLSPGLLMGWDREGETKAEIPPPPPQTKETRCGFCAGLGRTMKAHCTTCDASGYETCPCCEGDMRCRTCDGSGHTHGETERRCPACYGSGTAANISTRIRFGGDIGDRWVPERNLNTLRTAGATHAGAHARVAKEQLAAECDDGIWGVVMCRTGALEAPDDACYYQHPGTFLNARGEITA